LTDAATPALEVERLSFAYGKRPALRGVGFRILPGEFAVLLGPNGAGKSTLFSLATRLFDAPGEAAIRIFGADLRREPGRALAALGVVFQQPPLDPDLSVRESLLYHAALHGLPGAEARARAARELERVGLGDRAAERARNLSGGQRRRAEIARALLTRPSLLLLDEPTVGLDAASRAFLLGHVRGLCREEGLAVLWATHLIDEVGEEARVVVLREGEVRADGAVPAVLARAGGAATVAEAFARLTAAAPERAAGGPPERAAARATAERVP
jgi:ABC-2 type transport system ATP-binding protein